MKDSATKVILNLRSQTPQQSCSSVGLARESQLVRIAEKNGGQIGLPKLVHASSCAVQPAALGLQYCAELPLHVQAEATREMHCLELSYTS